MGKKVARPGGKPAFPPFMAGDDKRSAILRAAHKLFLRDGFSVTSMDAITREAGVSKATVYAHFAKKENLFEQLVRLGSEAALGSTPSLRRSGGDPKTELRSFFGPFLQLLFGSGAYAWDRMILAEAQRHPQNARLFYQCTIERITKSVEDYLADLTRDGGFSRPDVRQAAEAFIAVVLLAPLHLAVLLGPEAVDVRRSLETGLDLLLGKPASPHA